MLPQSIEQIINRQSAHFQREVKAVEIKDFFVKSDIKLLKKRLTAQGQSQRCGQCRVIKEKYHNKLQQIQAKSSLIYRLKKQISDLKLKTNTLSMSSAIQESPNFSKTAILRQGIMSSNVSRSSKIDKFDYLNKFDSILEQEEAVLKDLEEKALILVNQERKAKHLLKKFINSQKQKSIKSSAKKSMDCSSGQKIVLSRVQSQIEPISKTKERQQLLKNINKVFTFDYLQINNDQNELQNQIEKSSLLEKQLRISREKITELQFEIEKHQKLSFEKSAIAEQKIKSNAALISQLKFQNGLIAKQNEGLNLKINDHLKLETILKEENERIIAEMQNKQLEYQEEEIRISKQNEGIQILNEQIISLEKDNSDFFEKIKLLQIQIKQKVQKICQLQQYIQQSQQEQVTFKKLISELKTELLKKDETLNKISEENNRTLIEKENIQIQIVKLQQKYDQLTINEKQLLKQKEIQISIEKKLFQDALLTAKREKQELQSSIVTLKQYKQSQLQIFAQKIKQLIAIVASYQNNEKDYKQTINLMCNQQKQSEQKRKSLLNQINQLELKIKQLESYYQMCILEMENKKQKMLVQIEDKDKVVEIIKESNQNYIREISQLKKQLQFVFQQLDDKRIQLGLELEKNIKIVQQLNKNKLNQIEDLNRKYEQDLQLLKQELLQKEVEVESRNMEQKQQFILIEKLKKQQIIHQQQLQLLQSNVLLKETQLKNQAQKFISLNSSHQQQLSSISNELLNKQLQISQLSIQNTNMKQEIAGYQLQLSQFQENYLNAGQFISKHNNSLIFFFHEVELVLIKLQQKIQLLQTRICFIKTKIYNLCNKKQQSNQSKYLEQIKLQLSSKVDKINQLQQQLIERILQDEDRQIRNNKKINSFKQKIIDLQEKIQFLELQNLSKEIIIEQLKSDAIKKDEQTLILSHNLQVVTSKLNILIQTSKNNVKQTMKAQILNVQQNKQILDNLSNEQYLNALHELFEDYKGTPFHRQINKYLNELQSVDWVFYGIMKRCMQQAKKVQIAFKRHLQNNMKLFSQQEGEQIYEETPSKVQQYLENVKLQQSCIDHQKQTTHQYFLNEQIKSYNKQKEKPKYQP